MDRKTLLLEHNMVVNEGRLLTISEAAILHMYFTSEGYFLKGRPGIRVSVLTDQEWILSALRERDGNVDSSPMRTLKLVTQEEVDQWLGGIRYKLKGLL